MNRRRTAVICICLGLMLMLAAPAAVPAAVPDSHEPDIKRDTTPPVIIGAEDLSTTVGRAISYNDDVFAYDSMDGYVDLQVDNHEVDLMTEGVYQIIYSARDHSGNLALKVTTVTVDPAPDPKIEEYNAFADSILDEIITDTMDDYEKCCAVYDYIHHIPYVNTVYSEDWRENGYNMLSKRSGDCFGYYSASRLLLERLGYQIIEVQNQNGFTHVWCLVSTDGGMNWYHFDPTCWRWGSDGYLCMVTDEELTAYANRHYVGRYTVSHDWDRQQLATAIESIMSSSSS